MCAAPSGGRDGASRGAPRESRGAAAGKHRAGSAQRPPRLTPGPPPPLPPLPPRSAVGARGTSRLPPPPKSRLAPSARRGPRGASRSPPPWGSPLEPGVLPAERGTGARAPAPGGEAPRLLGVIRAEVCGGEPSPSLRPAKSPEAPFLGDSQQPAAGGRERRLEPVPGQASAREPAVRKARAYFPQSRCRDFTAKACGGFAQCEEERTARQPLGARCCTGSGRQRGPSPRALSPKYGSSGRNGGGAEGPGRGAPPPEPGPAPLLPWPPPTRRLRGRGESPAAGCGRGDRARRPAPPPRSRLRPAPEGSGRPLPPASRLGAAVCRGPPWGAGGGPCRGGLWPGPAAGLHACVRACGR